jgi:hypothetical protein
MQQQAFTSSEHGSLLFCFFVFANSSVLNYFYDVNRHFSKLWGLFFTLG